MGETIRKKKILWLTNQNLSRLPKASLPTYWQLDARNFRQISEWSTMDSEL